jgi:hypothetical protein
MLHNVEEEEQVKEILMALDQVFNLSLKINEVVSRLTEKRVTLEEKMIRAYFHEFAANLVSCAAAAHTRLANAYKTSTPRQKTSIEISQLNQDLSLHTDAQALKELTEASEVVIDDLLRILRYDLNFLEQYYEYDYYTKLTNERDFKAQAKELMYLMQEKACNQK